MGSETAVQNYTVWEVFKEVIHHTVERDKTAVLQTIGRPSAGTRFQRRDPRIGRPTGVDP